MQACICISEFTTFQQFTDAVNAFTEQTNVIREEDIREEDFEKISSILNEGYRHVEDALNSFMLLPDHMRNLPFIPLQNDFAASAWIATLVPRSQ
jgi:hypothetical protein